jgi:hypothetical protein
VPEFTTRRVFEKIDFEPSYPNALTSGALAAMKLPLFSMMMNRQFELQFVVLHVNHLIKVKVVRIKDTLHLSEIEVSVNYIPLLMNRSDILIKNSSSMCSTRMGELV